MARGIFKRKNSKHYWIRYAGLDRRIIRESSGSERFRDAEALLIKRRQEIKEGKQPEVKRIENYSFKALAEKYLAWTNGRQRSAETKKYIISGLIARYGDYPLRRFTTNIVEQLQTDIISKGLRPASNNKTLHILKHMFRKAVEWDMVGEDTLKGVRKVQPLKNEGKRLRYLSQEECKDLINACDPHLRPIVVTALNTGMRRGEILSLKWENVDLKHGFILLDKTKNGERREIPINATLRAVFNDLVRRVDSPYVFYHRKSGEAYQETKRSFKSACRKAGITDFRFHDLRHTFASHLIMAGVDLTTAKELLGHKDVKMTLRYAHLAPSHKVKALDILDRAFTGKLSSGGERLLHTDDQESSELTHLVAQWGNLR